MSDPVNHPAHYTNRDIKCGHCGAPIECIQVTEQFSFSRGNSIKYVWRAGEKDPAKEIQDLKKSVWYLQREIARLEKAAGK